MKNNICITTIGLQNTDIISDTDGVTTIHSLKDYLHELSIPYTLNPEGDEMILIYVNQIRMHQKDFMKLMSCMVKSISYIAWDTGTPILLPYIKSIHVRAADVKTKALPYLRSRLSRIWAHTDQVCRFRKIQIWIPLRKSARGAKVPEFYQKLIMIISQNTQSITQVHWK